MTSVELVGHARLVSFLGNDLEAIASVGRMNLGDELVFERESIGSWSARLSLGWSYASR